MEAPSDAVANPARLRSSSVWLLAAIAVFTGSTSLLLFTANRPSDPYEPPQFPKWLLYTIGPGKEALPAIQADLHAVATVDKGPVWIAGNNLFIAHSSDDGATWVKSRVDVPDLEPEHASLTIEPTTTAPPNAKPASARTPRQTPAKSTEPSAEELKKKQDSMRRQQAPATDVPPPASKPVKKSVVNRLLSLFETSAYAAETGVYRAFLNFSRVPAVPHENLVGIGYVDPSKALAIGSAGGVYEMNGDGSVWTYTGHFLFLKAPITATWFSPGNSWAVSDRKLIGLSSRNRYRELLTPFRATSIWVDSSSVIHAIADNGIHYQTDYGTTWTAAPAPAQPGVGVGPRGSIGGKQTSTKQDIHAVLMSGANGWAVGDRGVILRTTDGGASWRHVTRESTFTEASAVPTFPFLPPWYLILNTFTAYAFVRVRMLRERELIAKPTEGIEPTGETDRPLEPEDRESANLDPLAKTVADFLRNDQTKPPLTIAITGTWGSGKSSLMNLVRGHLVKAHWRPVWFNAWHHQKEESLLAALLQTIRMQAVPKIWHRGGPSFYARLFWIRLVDYRAHAIALLMLVLFSIGFVAGFPLLVDAVKAHSAAAPDIAGIIEDYFPSGVARFALVLASTVSVIYSLTKALSAFGVKPAQLLSQMSSGARIKDLEAQTTFRERFSREFAEVTDALNPKRSMLIFIDDLDRCRPENVVDVLEAVNFLVSAGDCFVILGMARDKVQPAVGLAFEKMAAEMEPPEGSEKLAGEDKAKALRRELARQYLDKLINMELPVPKLSDSESLKTLTRHEEGARPRDIASVVLNCTSVALATAILTLLPLSMLFSGVQLATSAYVAHTEHEIEFIKKTPRPKAPVVVPPVPTPAPAPTPTPAFDPSLASSDQPGRVVPPGVVHDRLMYWPAFAVLILLLWILWWLATRAAEEVVHDSAEFTKALEIWHTALHDALETPRALKRFKNRVRFMAMYARAKGARIRDHAIVAIAVERIRHYGMLYDKAFEEHVATFGIADVREAQPVFDDFFAEAHLT